MLPLAYKERVGIGHRSVSLFNFAAESATDEEASLVVLEGNMQSITLHSDTLAAHPAKQIKSLESLENTSHQSILRDIYSPDVNLAICLAAGRTSGAAVSSFCVYIDAD